MADLRGKQLKDGYQNLITKGSNNTFEDGDGNKVPIPYHDVTTFIPLFVPGDSRSYTYSVQSGMAWRWDNFVKARFRLHVSEMSGTTNDAMRFRLQGMPWNIDTSLNDADHLWLEISRLISIQNFTNYITSEMIAMYTHTTANTIRLGPHGEASINDDTILEGTLYYHTDS